MSVETASRGLRICRQWGWAQPPRNISRVVHCEQLVYWCEVFVGIGMSKDSFFNAPIMCYSTSHTNWTFIAFVCFFVFVLMGLSWCCCFCWSALRRRLVLHELTVCEVHANGGVGMCTVNQVWRLQCVTARYGWTSARYSAREIMWPLGWEESWPVRCWGGESCVLLRLMFCGMCWFFACLFFFLHPGWLMCASFDSDVLCSRTRLSAVPSWKPPLL